MILPAIVVIATVATGSVGASREAGPHYAFVGEFVSVQQMQPCNDHEPIPEGKSHLDYISPSCRGFYQVFRVRYRVVAPLAGSPPPSEVELFVNDHYGQPGFFEQANALVVVTKYEGRAWMRHNLGFSVLPLRGGGWAACGSPTASRDDDGKRVDGPMPRSLEFARPLLELRADDDPDWIADLRADPDFHVDGDTVHCRRGVTVTEMIDDLRRGLAEDGVIFGSPPGS